MKVATLLFLTFFLGLTAASIGSTYRFHLGAETWAMIAALSYPGLLVSALAMPFTTWRV